MHESTSKLFEFFLLPLGFMFSTYGGPFMGWFLVLKMIFVEAKLAGNQVPTKKDQVHMFWLAFVHMMGVVAITTTLKKIFKRTRPQDPRDPKFKGDTPKRLVNLRGPETNCGFPSGDTTQSSQYVTFVALYLPRSFFFLGGVPFAATLVFGVASARIFYHCHYYGDTIAGALLGVAIAYMFYYLDVNSAVGVFVDNLPIPAEWE